MRCTRCDVHRLRVRRAVMVDGMSMREAARVFRACTVLDTGLSQDAGTIRSLSGLVAGRLRQRGFKLGAPSPPASSTGSVEDDLRRHPSSSATRHEAACFEPAAGRVRYSYGGSYATVKDYGARENRRQTREMFVPLSHPPGHAQCDFGEAFMVVIAASSGKTSLLRHRPAPQRRLLRELPILPDAPPRLFLPRLDVSFF